MQNSYKKLFQNSARKRIRKIKDFIEFFSLRKMKIMLYSKLLFNNFFF